MDVNANDSEMLRRAAMNGDLKSVIELLKLGANVNAKDNHALLMAACNGYFDVVKTLVEAGADVSAKEFKALEYAAENGHVDIVDYLIQQGSQITETAVLRAYYNECDKTVELFRKYYKKPQTEENLLELEEKGDEN